MWITNSIYLHGVQKFKNLSSHQKLILFPKKIVLGHDFR